MLRAFSGRRFERGDSPEMIVAEGLFLEPLALLALSERPTHTIRTRKVAHTEKLNRHISTHARIATVYMAIKAFAHRRPHWAW